MHLRSTDSQQRQDRTSLRAGGIQFPKFSVFSYPPNPPPRAGGLSSEQGAPVYTLCTPVCLLRAVPNPSPPGLPPSIPRL